MGLGKFIQRMKDAKVSRTASDAEKYAAIIRRGAIGDLSAADSKQLEGLAEALGKTPEMIAADEAIVADFYIATELGKSAETKRDAAKAAGRARDDFALDVEKKNKEFAIRQHELVAAVGPAQVAASEALAAKERAKALGKTHWAILGLSQPPAAPVLTPPQMNTPRPPAPPLSQKEIEAAAERNAANQRLNNPISGPTMDSIREQTLAQQKDIQKARPPKKDAAPNVDPVAKAMWLEAQGKGPAAQVWDPRRKTRTPAL
jgi:hypothetical protein